MRHSKLDNRALTLFPLVLTLFCLVSGGPHGLEEAVSVAGPGLAVILICLLPFVWALPIALMTAELTSAIPVEGGYYEWAKRGLNRFWGFQCGWWTWLYTMADAAIYPVLFASYLSTFLHLIGGNAGFAEHWLFRWIIALAVIIVFGLLNIRGTRLVGLTSVILGILLTAPFVVMGLVGLFRWFTNDNPVAPTLSPREGGLTSALAGGLYIVMWNYLGWDTLSTVTEEVDNPTKTFPRALLWCVPFVAIVYVLAVVVGLKFSPNFAAWTEGSWPLIAKSVGGQWLALLVSFAGLLSPLALYVTAVLGASRIPFVLAEERYFPKGFITIHPRYKTPWVAIVFCSAIYAILSFFFTFQKLVELNVTLYLFSLIPEFLSLVVLRFKSPNMPRPFTIPGGKPGVIFIALLPFIVGGLALYASLTDPEEGVLDQLPVLILIATGPIFYFIQSAFRRQRAQSR